MVGVLVILKPRARVGAVTSTSEEQSQFLNSAQLLNVWSSAFFIDLIV